MATHDFDNKRARMRACSCVDIIYRFADTVEGSRRADRQIRQRHIVIDGSHQSDDAEVTISRCLFLGNRA